MNRKEFIRTSVLFSFLNSCFILQSCRSQEIKNVRDGKDILEIEQVILLPNVIGRLDHLALDRKNERIFIAAIGNNSVEVIDLKTNSVINQIKNLNEPQGIVYIPETNSIFVSNGGNGICNVYETKTFHLVNSFSVGEDADNVRYDSVLMRVYVGYGNGGIAVIDANDYKKINDIKLTGHPESFQLTKGGKKMFVNVPSAHQIEIIDLDKNIVSDRWQVNEAKSNFPMELDENNNRLFVGCRKPAKLIVINTNNGETIAALDCSGDVDDIYYDGNSKLIYLSCGEGYIDIFKQKNSDSYERISKITTSYGSRTCIFDSTSQRLYLAVPFYNNETAKLIMYKVNTSNIK